MWMVGPVIIGSLLIWPILRLICDAQIWPEDLHEPRRIGQQCETVSLIQSVSITGAEQNTTHMLQDGMAHDATDQPFRETTASVRFQHKHIAKPGECCPVGHDASEADLVLSRVQSEAKGVFQGTADYFERSPRRPIGAVGQKVMDHRYVKEAGVGRNEKIALSCDLV